MSSLRASGMMHRGPCLELLGFCPRLAQFNGVQWRWLQSLAPPSSPGVVWMSGQSRFPPITCSANITLNKFNDNIKRVPLSKDAPEVQVCKSFLPSWHLFCAVVQWSAYTHDSLSAGPCLHRQTSWNAWSSVTVSVRGSDGSKNTKDITYN